MPRHAGMASIPMRASSAMQPVSSEIRGLRSSSRISGISAESCAIFTSVSADGVHVGRRNVAVTFEQAIDARARHQRPGERHVERRQGQRLVVDDLHRRAAPPNTTTGPKWDRRQGPRSVRAAWPMDHRLHRHAVDHRAPAAWPATRASISRAAFTTACSLDRFSTTPPTSDLCVICWDRIFTATADPKTGSRRRSAPASSGVPAARPARPEFRRPPAPRSRRPDSSQRSPLASPSRTSARAPSVSG